MTSQDTQRWCSHLKGCDETPSEVKLILSRKRDATTAFVETPSGLLEQVEETSVSGVSLDRSSNNISSFSSRKISHWLDRINGSDNAVLDELFDGIFYHTGIPFRLAESPSFRAFITKPRPAYEIPSAKQVAGNLILQAHKKKNFVCL